jgi:DNA-binding response OmpR family regulator
MSQREVLPREGIQVFIPPARNGRAASKPTAMNVLVAEDDRDVRTLLRLVLRLDGHQVTEAPNLNDAFARAIEIHPDLIVLDRKFPQSDGMTALRRLRESDQTRDVPVILLSGKSEAEDQVAGLEGGADAYLVKPFDPFLFLETVWEITGMTSSERAEVRATEIARLRALSRSG